MIRYVHPNFYENPKKKIYKYDLRTSYYTYVKQT